MLCVFKAGNELIRPKSAPDSNICPTFRLTGLRQSTAAAELIRPKSAPDSNICPTFRLTGLRQSTAAADTHGYVCTLLSNSGAAVPGEATRRPKGLSFLAVVTPYGPTKLTGLRQSAAAADTHGYVCTLLSNSGAAVPREATRRPKGLSFLAVVIPYGPTKYEVNPFNQLIRPKSVPDSNICPTFRLTGLRQSTAAAELIRPKSAPDSNICPTFRLTGLRHSTAAADTHGYVCTLLIN
ncbi:hypothetical protein Bbelb_222580 [Branchiostoma belcheri]|nr:hypothetical protein Bbelb_222580 [Branchiostoma belcheri]